MSDHNILRLGAQKLHLDLQGREELLLAHLDLVRKWNPKIRLIGHASPGEEVVLHILDSLAALPMISFQVIRHLDVGSGAGFPGIPLNVMWEGTETFLAEKIEKKAAFLRECVRRLGLGHVRVLNRNVGPTFPVEGTGFDLITFRALGKLKDLLPLLVPFLSDSGWILAFKGPGLQGEIEEAAGILESLHLRPIFHRDLILPFLERPRSIAAFSRG